MSALWPTKYKTFCACGMAYYKLLVATVCQRNASGNWLILSGRTTDGNIPNGQTTPTTCRSSRQIGHWFKFLDSTLARLASHLEFTWCLMVITRQSTSISEKKLSNVKWYGLRYSQQNGCKNSSLCQVLADAKIKISTHHHNSFGGTVPGNNETGSSTGTTHHGCQLALSSCSSWTIIISGAGPIVCIAIKPKPHMYVSVPALPSPTTIIAPSGHLSHSYST